MPSLASLQTHLAHFLAVTSAAEVVLFERTTFLVISSVTADSVTYESGASTPSVSQEWDERRFERISTMVKAFKLGCSSVILRAWVFLTLVKFQY
jgi:Ras-related GTP-binding protein A/B